MPAIDTIPKELFLLMGTVLGGVLALAGAVLTALINSRTQLKLARETHRQQYQLEALKVQAQAEREEEACIREKFEEVHQLLSKMIMEYSLTASYIALETGMTKEEYHARYLGNHADVCRLKAVVALYFPPLKDTTEGLDGLTNQFWGCQQHLLYQVAQGQPEHDRQKTMDQVVQLGKRVEGRMRQVQNDLATMTQSMITFKGARQ